MPAVSRLLQLFKNWMLVIGMVTGAGLYICYRLVPALHPAGGFFLSVCSTLQPFLLFLMLFLTFSKIEPRDLKPHRWQWWLLLIQGGTFTLLALLLVIFPNITLRMGVESFMLCLIMPTATATAVITDRLGGDTAGVLTYTVLINMLDAILVPLLVPLIHPVAGLDFVSTFNLILAKVFPLLILPCLCAWLVRYMFPKLHRWLKLRAYLSFYIWAASLVLAILMSARALYHNDGSGWTVVEIAVASLIGCALQFGAGKVIGAAYDRKGKDGNVREITAGQSLGQKNTVFGIWMGYTFLTPVISLAGGFYSIWHNCFNTWQLRRKAEQGQ